VGQGQADVAGRLLGRLKLPFRAVNQKGGMQRHHLLPQQLLSKRCFGALFEELGRDRMGFDDFRSNGLLLPASDQTAQRVGLPLHRGPHRDYNSMVIERVGQVEARWSQLRLRAPEIAANEAVQRLTLLQRALRRRLLKPRKAPFVLNRRDPIGRGIDFAELDAMVDVLWPETNVEVVPMGTGGTAFALASGIEMGVLGAHPQCAAPGVEAITGLIHPR
jgi:hypothetical protein